MKIITTHSPLSPKVPLFNHSAMLSEGFNHRTKDSFEKPAALKATIPNKISQIFKERITNYEVLGGGENNVFLINNEWIFRSPKQKRALDGNQREQTLLNKLTNYVKSTSIPRYDFWDHENGIGGYKIINGISLSYKIYNKLSSLEKHQFAHDLAVAISEIHALPVKDAPFLKNYRAEAKGYLDSTRILLQPPSIFSEQERQRIKEALTIAEDILAKPDSSLVVMHSDLHGDNIIVNQKTKTLSGIIDFSDARLGSAVIDFSYMYRVSPILAETVALHYARIKNIDPFTFLRECRSWSIVWQASCIGANYQGTTLRQEKRVIRAGKALNYLLSLKEF